MLDSAPRRMNCLMTNMLTSFVRDATQILGLAFAGPPIPAKRLVDYAENQRHLAFLRDLVGRVRMLELAFERLSSLSHQVRDVGARMQNLPSDERGWKTIPMSYGLKSKGALRRSIALSLSFTTRRKASWTCSRS